MFKGITVITIITLLLSNVMLQSVVVLDFKLNQDLIAETLCIQKEEIQNTCNGKCHLNKQLEKTENDSDEAPARTEVLREILLYCSINRITYLTPNERPVQNSPSAQRIEGIEVLYSVFHPPRLI